MSAAPLRSASAQSDGTVNESSYLPWSGPCVKPRTSGAVFRYCTTEMRSLFTLGWLAEIDYSRLKNRTGTVSDGVKGFSVFGGFNHAEARDGRDRSLFAT